MNHRLPLDGHSEQKRTAEFNKTMNFLSNHILKSDTKNEKLFLEILKILLLPSQLQKNKSVLTTKFPRWHFTQTWCVISMLIFSTHLHFHTSQTFSHVNFSLWTSSLMFQKLLFCFFHAPLSCNHKPGPVTPASTSSAAALPKIFTFRPPPQSSSSSSSPTQTSALLVATLHIVCREHARLAGPLHGAVHPALIDGLSIDDDISVAEGNLVVVLRCVVVQRPVDALQETGQPDIRENNPDTPLAPLVVWPVWMKEWYWYTMVAECGGEVTDLTDDMLVWCM